MSTGKQYICDYVNACTKCFAAFSKQDGSPYTTYISHKWLQDNILIVGLEREVLSLKEVINKHIALTMWHKIKGYQLKGTRIENHNIDSTLTDAFQRRLKDSNEDSTTIAMAVYKIEEMYHVSPGERAGKKI
jgi:hypothetical protein